ncbi:integrin alpha-7 isoform X1 [Latimeria chalumnae]|uniref:integrin alpha-7 isoform X1 n=1 Tax=Latimeria chalumnae TaxID=7897 RepID=UPI00313C901A
MHHPELFSTLPWLLLLLLLPRVSGFNLDATDTILKEGPKGSLFGFSVALHRQLQPDPFSRILVGAPQALALANQQANRTGALFSCPLTKEDDDCEQVEIDGEVDLNKESKENQWLGVTVKSQGIGGKVVVCAHLYEFRQRVKQPSETRDVIGRCYVLSQDLTISDDLDGGDWKFCEGRPQGHQRFGFCQQGISVSFTSDNHYILFGAPGTYNWKGNLRIELFNHQTFDLNSYDDGPYEAGGEKEQDPRLIPVPSNSYFGFSVDSGKGLTRKRELSFVAGAPRANHTGAVIILKKDNVNRLVPEYVLWGEELASSFGYSVAVTDLNNDGWMDLIVGAPNFFDRKEEIGGGAYVYINQVGNWNEVKPVRLNGTYHSMFGLVVASIGDVNQDGYGDIAVGAPFDGAGKVYIFHGNSLGVNTKPAQILDGEGVGVKKFGYSISGGLDIDENSYPDLVVGSLSDSVVLYRARPVTNITSEIKINPENIDLEQNTCRNSLGVCVDVRTCFNYNANPTTYKPRLTLGYMLEADGERRKLGLAPRVQFLRRKHTDAEHQFSDSVELHAQGETKCATATFQLQENLRDKLRTIPVTLTYRIKHARLRRQAKEELEPLMPVLNAQYPNSIRAEVNFLREGCGEDKVCQSNLQLHYQFCSRVGSNTDTFTPLPLDSNKMAVFSLTDQEDVALEITVTNSPSDRRHPHRDGDDAHAAQLIASIPDTLTYSAFRSHQDKQLVCAANQNGSRVECELGNPMKRDAKVTFYLILSTSGINIETTELAVDLQLATISEQPDLEPVTARASVVLELPLSVTGSVTPRQLFYSGNIVGESAMEKEEDVGMLAEYEFAVSNRGQSLKTLGSAFLNVMWPYEVSNGKWLLYPIRVHFEGNHRMQCASTHVVNQLKLDFGQKKRRKREVERMQVDNAGSASGSAWPVAYSERKKTHILDCTLGTAKCVVFQCPLYSFDAAAVLKIRSRLWNSTFLEDFSSVSSIELIVRANITVKSSIKNLVLREAMTQIQVTVYPDQETSEYTGIPWWIILIAILAGILVLALLVLLLWKCGFFKRSKYQEDNVPQYHAVKIPKEDREQFKEEKTGTFQKKEWVTNWRENESFS